MESYWTLPSGYFSVSTEIPMGILPIILLIWCILLIQKLLLLSGFSWWLSVVWLCYRPRCTLKPDDFNCQLYSLHMQLTVSILMQMCDISKPAILASHLTMFSDFSLLVLKRVFLVLAIVFFFLLWLKFEKRTVWLIDYFQNAMNQIFPVVINYESKL